MIYEFPSKEAPIRQGDIFLDMPRIDLPRLNRGALGLPLHFLKRKNFTQHYLGRSYRVAVLGRHDSLHRTNCHADDHWLPILRNLGPTFYRVVSNLITQHARINQKWFYLPPDEKIGFDLKMAVDFRITLRVLREDLEQLKALRVGRLNRLAEDHFRERLGEFWRRYAYDEWYSLSPAEFAEYCKDREGVEPFPWQKS